MRLNGIFEDFVNKCSFVDRAVLGVWGDRRRVIGDGIEIIRNAGIASPTSPYARVWIARCRATGNPVQWKYGKYLQTPWKNKLAPFQFTMRTDEAPLTCAQLNRAIGSVVCNGSRTLVSLAELTFDTDIPIRAVCRDVFTKARVLREMENAAGMTLYIGSPRSPWQMRVYQKTACITRVEFVLRTPVLRALNINQPQDLLLLRTANLWKLVWWRTFAPVPTAVEIGRHTSGVQTRACLALLRRSSRSLDRLLRAEYTIPTARLLHDSSIESTLRQMQDRLIW